MTEKIVMCACNTPPIRFFNKPGFQHEITTPNDTLLLFNGWGSILGVGAAKIFSFRLYSQYGCIIISQSEDSVFIQPIWEYNCSKFIQPNWVYIMDKWNHHIGCITCRMGCNIQQWLWRYFEPLSLSNNCLKVLEWKEVSLNWHPQME